MTITPSFEMSGSILAGTAEHRLAGIETDLDITADAEPAVLAELVDRAERMCFVLDAINRAHEVNGRVSVNGKALERG